MSNIQVSRKYCHVCVVVMEQHFQRKMLWFLLKTLWTKAHEAQFVPLKHDFTDWWRILETSPWKIHMKSRQTQAAQPQRHSWVQTPVRNLEGANWTIFQTNEKKEAFLENDSRHTSEEGSSTTHPLKVFHASCLYNSLSLSLFFSLFFLHHSILVALVGSRWTYISLWAGGVDGVTMACVHCLICLDHGYEAYLDNKAACQHLPSHTPPHTLPCTWLEITEKQWVIASQIVNML